MQLADRAPTTTPRLAGAGSWSAAASPIRGTTGARLVPTLNCEEPTKGRVTRNRDSAAADVAPSGVLKIVRRGSSSPAGVEAQVLKALALRSRIVLALCRRWGQQGRGRGAGVCRGGGGVYAGRRAVLDSPGGVRVMSGILGGRRRATAWKTLDQSTCMPRACAQSRLRTLMAVSSS